MFTFGLRLFHPTAYAIFSCPLRDRTWKIDTTALDYRAAQEPEALVPRDGLWYSSESELLAGDLVLVSPLEGASLGLPTTLSVSIRVSWHPAHLNVSFVTNAVHQKVSFRPVKDRSCHWYGIDFEPNLFPTEVKNQIPHMCYIPGEGPLRKISSPPQNPENDWNDWND